MMQKNSSPPLSSLAVLGVGLSINGFDLNNVWRQLNEHPADCILPADIPVRPLPEKEQHDAYESECSEALNAATGKFTLNWAIPGVSVWPARGEQAASKKGPDSKDELHFFFNRLSSLGKLVMKPQPAFAPTGIVFSDEPDDVLERAFQFFEQNPTVPALVLYANDGHIAREKTGNTSFVPYRKDKPRRMDSLVDSAACILLARRECVNAMRQFLGSRATHLYAEGPAKPGFRPSRFLPQLWTHEQVDQFDRLPTIGFVHRPIRIGFCFDQAGNITFDHSHPAKPMNARERQKAFDDGIKVALDIANGRKPSRIFHDAGPYGVSPNGSLLGSAMYDCLPEFDANSPSAAFDMFSRIGNLGATSAMAQLTLSLAIGKAAKGISLTINLRQKDEATITVVSA